MEWNDETIARLRLLWDEGLSTAEIGRRLGVSKNAVVGKAHRMMLPPRPSPIRRDGPVSARASTPRRVTGPTLPPLPASCQEGSRVDLPRPAVPEPWRPTHPPHRAAPTAAAAQLQGPARPVVPSVEPQVPIRTTPPISGRSSACCWPLGEPGTRSFRFCDGPSMPAKPYCVEHAQLAYVKVRDRREEAA